VNIKQLIDADFFPTDDRGFYLVPMAHGEGDIVHARVIATDADGEYPLLGLGANGYPTQWDANGRPRPDHNPYFLFNDDEMEINSLVMPETQVEHVEYVVTNANDDVLFPVRRPFTVRSGPARFELGQRDCGFCARDWRIRRGMQIRRAYRVDPSQRRELNGRERGVIGSQIVEPDHRHARTREF